jgi:hypothetical protein
MIKQGCELRCYDYVNRPYAQVRDVLIEDPLALLQAATCAASRRAQSIASELRLDLGGITLETEINISIKDMDECISQAMSGPLTRIELEWRAAATPHLFPLMKAEIAIYPLTATETQLDFSGHYEPPFGVLGRALNAMIGHRIAEVSVHRFLGDVAQYLRTDHCTCCKPLAAGAPPLGRQN